MPVHRLFWRRWARTLSQDAFLTRPGGVCVHRDRFRRTLTWMVSHTGVNIGRKNWEHEMKIVVIGGSGLIGSKLVNKLREHGHEAVAAAPDTGVNTLTGEGLAEVLKGAL